MCRQASRNVRVRVSQTEHHPVDNSVSRGAIGRLRSYVAFTRSAYAVQDPTANKKTGHTAGIKWILGLMVGPG